jgi:hypothetical protein
MSWPHFQSLLRGPLVVYKISSSGPPIRLQSNILSFEEHHKILGGPRNIKSLGTNVSIKMIQMCAWLNFNNLMFIFSFIRNVCLGTKYRLVERRQSSATAIRHRIGIGRRRIVLGRIQSCHRRICRRIDGRWVRCFLACNLKAFLGHSIGGRS